MHDPNDKQDLTTVVTHKGQQYCFIAAIIDADHAIPKEEWNNDQKCGLLKETLDIFEGGKKQMRDYHGMFNHEYFVVSMTKFLEVLKERNVSNTIIVMDNTKYHKKLPKEVPRKSYRKWALWDTCWRHKIDFNKIETKLTSWKN